MVAFPLTRMTQVSSARKLGKFKSASQCHSSTFGSPQEKNPVVQDRSNNLQGNNKSIINYRNLVMLQLRSLL